MVIEGLKLASAIFAGLKHSSSEEWRQLKQCALGRLFKDGGFGNPSDDLQQRLQVAFQLRSTLLSQPLGVTRE